MAESVRKPLREQLAGARCRRCGGGFEGTINFVRMDNPIGEDYFWHVRCPEENAS